jgi:hypothetical protein
MMQQGSRLSCPKTIAHQFNPFTYFDLDPRRNQVKITQKLFQKQDSESKQLLGAVQALAHRVSLKSQADQVGGAEVIQCLLARDRHGLESNNS